MKIKINSFFYNLQHELIIFLIYKYNYYILCLYILDFIITRINRNDLEI